MAESKNERKKENEKERKKQTKTKRDVILSCTFLYVHASHFHMSFALL